MREASPSQLAALVDHHEIVQLTVDYTWALDTRNFEALRNVFAADATAELRGTYSGVDAIIARITKALSPLDDSQHLIGNHQVRIDGDTATCRCYLVAQHVVRNTPGGDNYIIAGRYEDRLARTAEGWRITHRSLVTMWTEGNLAVITPK